MFHLIKMKDGTVGVMQLVSGTVDEAVAKWPDAAKENVLSHGPVNIEDLPKDRYFRNAWDHDLNINMDKAREIQMEYIRRARDEKLEILDVETLKGIDVQAEKQVLRDLPQTFDLSIAKTPEELKELWPEELMEVKNE